MFFLWLKKNGSHSVNSSCLELISMATTTVPPKSNSKQSKNSPTASNDKNDTPVTEEDLLKKETPINTNDVLRLKKPTKGIDQKSR